METNLNFQKVHKHIVDWMNSYMKNSGQKIWIIGVSGGIDSALVSTLCAQTEYPVLCLEMPIHQDPSHVSRAEKHIEWLQEKYDNVFSIKVNLTKTFDLFENTFVAINNLPLNYTQEKTELGLANTRSRMRMTTLYYYSNLLNGLVCGTGNKVEDFGVGFFTIGGDGQVDLSPIADLMKSEVRELARVLGINQEIIDAVPSDGLWGDSRSDEDQLQAKYSELEWSMKFIENHPDGISLDISSVKNITNRQKEVLNIYKSRHLNNLHKMQPIPVCLVSDFRN